MKIQYCSDLHLEFDDNRDYLDMNPICPNGDILVLAGDVVPFSAMNKANYFFDEISEAFDAVYWIPGNHEYYYGDISGQTGAFTKNIRPNVHLVNNRAILMGDTRLLCSTMWTNISEQEGYRIRSIMSDFRVINAGNHTLTVADYNQLHAENIDFLSSELRKPFPGKTIVVTHHIPTFQNYPKEYRGSVLNEAFAVDLSGLIKETNPDYWIFGHHHSNVAPFKIGTTLLLTNQLGYVQNNEQAGFDTGKFIEL